MNPIRAVTVYCSSSRHVAAYHFDAARELGRGIASQGWHLVYGGNCVGLMDSLASTVREAGGKVIGITPQLMVDEGIVDRQCDELLITRTMRDRKELLEQRGDAFIALPGGIGTFEELFEILVARVLGCHDKPIVVLNVGGYYDPLVAMIEHGIQQRFIKPAIRKAYIVAGDVPEAIEHLRRHASGSAEPRPAPAEPSAME